jgi:hypothetical protein
MKYTSSIPTAVLGLMLMAACDSSDQPAAPDPTVTPRLITAQQAALSSDNEYARAAQNEVPGFAGYYLQEDGTPVVRLVDQSQRAAAQRYLAPQFAAAARRGHRSASAPVQQPIFKAATYDFAQLNAWSEALVPMLRRSGVYLIDVDEVQNQVLVGVADGAAMAAVRSKAARLGIPEDALRFQTQAAPRVRALVRDRFTTFVGGIQIAFGQYLCTAGFNAKRVSNGANVFVTNSHCTTNQYASDGVTIYQNTILAGNAVGNEVADRALYACVAGVAACRKSDAVYISHNGTRTIGQGGIARTNWATGAAGGLTTIGEFDIIGRYTGTLPVGSYLDKTGRTSGSTYGLVTNSCVTIGELRCQDISKVWSEGGDSGSPVYVYIGGAGAAENDVQLHGVMWGGPGSDWTTTYSSRLSGIEADLGALNSLCRPGYGC